ncbi:uncharacterized protein LOC114897806 [Monodon monoceros]|uniref:uncharacterized protein LOC114897806 n=1 Tax=Monodon monoceros TaxID=40151 RepID=UPI0010F49644|nr:uncharacterized protein LOC114897806 [Monodon monoceros]
MQRAQSALESSRTETAKTLKASDNQRELKLAGPDAPSASPAAARTDSEKGRARPRHQARRPGTPAHPPRPPRLPCGPPPGPSETAPWGAGRGYGRSPAPDSGGNTNSSGRVAEQLPGGGSARATLPALALSRPAVPQPGRAPPGPALSSSRPPSLASQGSHWALGLLNSARRCRLVLRHGASARPAPPCVKARDGGRGSPWIYP